MILYINCAIAFFIGVCHLLIQSKGFVISAWILSLSFFISAIIANIYLFRFPKLNFLILRKFSKRIVQKHPDAGIKKIILRKYDSPYQRQLKGNVPTKYHLIILTDSPISNEGKSLQRSATNFHNPNCNDLQTLGLSNDFSEVYKQNPNNDFLSEWRFQVTDNISSFNLKGHFDKCWTTYIRNFT